MDEVWDSAIFVLIAASHSSIAVLEDTLQVTAAYFCRVSDGNFLRWGILGKTIICRYI